MAVIGPVVVVAEHSATAWLEMLGQAGAFPIIEANLVDAPAAIAEIQPVAVVLPDAAQWHNGPAGAALIKKIEDHDGPLMPVLARVNADGEVPVPNALPIGQIGRAHV